MAIYGQMNLLYEKFALPSRVFLAERIKSLILGIYHHCSFMPIDLFWKNLVEPFLSNKAEGMFCTAKW